jgi:hypothetical protein
MDLAALIVNAGIFVASLVAAWVAWWQANAAGLRQAEAQKSSIAANQARAEALLAQQAASNALIEANEITKQTRDSADRAAMRVKLREWFQTLSKTASVSIQHAEPRLRAQIEEEADERGLAEILTAMQWARSMHDGTYDLIRPDGVTELQAHNLRVIIKRRFRRFIMAWSYDRSNGAALIHGYTKKGWPALLQEPGWRESTREAPIGAVSSVTELQAERDWIELPDSNIDSRIIARTLSTFGV